ncbi:hypothetical protein ILYODFUR_038371 [Ilyodon furcidens]|uniref:Uncharacterized protein n=1 Tax=Ilyodon furcidens TaxID=33524 RepID=A0ABV0TUI5_9TELE
MACLHFGYLLPLSNLLQAISHMSRQILLVTGSTRRSQPVGLESSLCRNTQTSVFQKPSQGFGHKGVGSELISWPHHSDDAPQWKTAGVVGALLLPGNIACPESNPPPACQSEVEQHSDPYRVTELGVQGCAVRPHLHHGAGELGCGTVAAGHEPLWIGWLVLASLLAVGPPPGRCVYHPWGVKSVAR